MEKIGVTTMHQNIKDLKNQLDLEYERLSKHYAEIVDKAINEVADNHIALKQIYDDMDKEGTTESKFKGARHYLEKANKKLDKAHSYLLGAKDELVMETEIDDDEDDCFD